MAPKCLILFLLLLCSNFLDFSMQQLVQSPPCFGARASPVPGVAGGCCCSTQSWLLGWIPRALDGSALLLLAFAHYQPIISQ